MRHLVHAAGLENHISCDSAGTIGYHAGHAPDSRMTQCARARGITLCGKARPFQVRDFTDFDLILTMDGQNFADIMERAPDATARAKVIPMVSFSTLVPRPKDVPDPYYGGQDGFVRVMQILENACANLLAEIQAQLPA